MNIEIDQSGKIHDTGVQTVLAFSNGESHSILISTDAKRECLGFIRANYKEAPLRQIYMRLFAAAIFLLLKGHLLRLTSVRIDVEYTGYDETIKRVLLQHIWKETPDFAAETIWFGLIGKESRAHIKARAVFRKEQPPGETIQARELLELLGK